jgi:hypothetical protein
MIVDLHTIQKCLLRALREAYERIILVLPHFVPRRERAGDLGKSISIEGVNYRRLRRKRCEYDF